MRAFSSDAVVAMKYRGYWFYVDATDVATKEMFMLLKILWSVRVADATGDVQLAPLLTVPVSR